MTYTQKDLLEDWNKFVAEAQQAYNSDCPKWEDMVVVKYSHAIRFILTQCQATLLFGDSEMRANLAEQIEEFIK